MKLKFPQGSVWYFTKTLLGENNTVTFLNSVQHWLSCIGRCLLGMRVCLYSVFVFPPWYNVVSMHQWLHLPRNSTVNSSWDLPVPVGVATMLNNFQFCFLHFYSRCAVEGSGRHSYNENKEVGSGQGENSTVSFTIHISLPQAWCQWTTSKHDIFFYQLVNFWSLIMDMI